MPHEQEVKSLQEAQTISRTRYCWVINYLSDYTGFDFLWEPVPWEAHQTHVWPSQHQENSGTYLVPKHGGDDFNRSHPMILRKGSVPIVGIDHGNGLSVQTAHSTRYISDYLGTMRRVLGKVTDEYVWVIGSVCDYTGFDFTWHPSEWQLDMLHVFPSNEQKFGDTFYVHVPSFLSKTADLKILEWFDTLHFVQDIAVPRLPMPSIQYDTDSVVDAIWQHEFKTPLVEFYSNISMDQYKPTVSLWQESTKTVVPLSSGSGTVIVPRECKNYIKTQVYDYPYIDKSKIYLKDRPLDIVFISNSEPSANNTFTHLKNVTSDLFKEQQIHHVKDVNGRVAAYHAAAQASTTPWFFAVFAKLFVNEKFDWDWQPDRLQEPKHYIFHALNPVNGLEYGHQAMIAYNKKLVLDTTGAGLDFTLDSAHEVVPILSGTALYNISPWVAWRTAFREVLKLQASLPDVENEYRLTQWLSTNPGSSQIVNEEWSRWGAEDAVEYYNEVSGNFDALKKSYEWEWLASYAFMKRSLLPSQ